MRRPDLRLILALAPGLLLGTIAVAIASVVEPASRRFVLELLAVGSVAAMSWRVGAAALGGTISRAHGVPNRLQAVTSDHRRITFDRDTGLHEEWYFRLRAEEEIARAKRYGQPFTIVNVIGRSNEALDAPRIEIRHWLREVDFAGDLGDVIAVCLPNTTRSGAWPVVERLTTLAQDVDVTLTEYPADGQTLSALVGGAQWRTRPARAA